MTDRKGTRPGDRPDPDPPTHRPGDRPDHDLPGDRPGGAHPDHDLPAAERPDGSTDRPNQDLPDTGGPAQPKR
jgi:hypothetical protein